MKNLLVIFITVVLCAGFAFAQTNTATVDQYGTNIGIINQTGLDNDAAIDQGTLATPVTNNKVPGYVGDWIGGAFIDQVGVDNDASINMHNGGNNGSSVYQFGDDNKGYQDIGTSHSIGTSWTLMGVDLDQLGDNNWATQKTVSSFGSAGVKRMFVIQDGDYNIADQLSIGGYTNAQDIVQKGDNNNNPTESGNAFDLSATGLANPLSLPWAHKPAGDYTQYSNQMYGTTHMYVEGNDNNTAQYQEYTVWGLSGRNHAMLDLYGNTNDVAQGQLGEYNSSDFDILGDGNVVTGLQWGDSNIATVYILGNNNVAAIEQLNDGNNGSINQVGSGNTGLILQQP
ncbi:MAG: hypothetical protein MUO40_12940 [Anaerolineaceae bacterium]|nr:hypothetical protein [Anaerolineaceae bacterium]